LTVEENFRLSKKINGRKIIDNFLSCESFIVNYEYEFLELEKKILSFRNTKAKNLSGGQKHMLTILLNYNPKSKLVLMDRPFSNFDKDVKKLLINWIRAIALEKRTVVVFDLENDEILQNSDFLIQIENDEPIKIRPIDISTSCTFVKIKKDELKGSDDAKFSKQEKNEKSKINKSNTINFKIEDKNPQDKILKILDLKDNLKNSSKITIARYESIPSQEIDLKNAKKFYKENDLNSLTEGKITSSSCSLIRLSGIRLKNIINQLWRRNITISMIIPLFIFVGLGLLLVNMSLFSENVVNFLIDLNRYSSYNNFQFFTASKTDSKKDFDRMSKLSTLFESKIKNIDTIKSYRELIDESLKETNLIGGVSIFNKHNKLFMRTWYRKEPMIASFILNLANNYAYNYLFDLNEPVKLIEGSFRFLKPNKAYLLSSEPVIVISLVLFLLLTISLCSLEIIDNEIKYGYFKILNSFGTPDWLYSFVFFMINMIEYFANVYISPLIISMVMNSVTMIAYGILMSKIIKNSNVTIILIALADILIIPELIKIGLDDIKKGVLKTNKLEMIFPQMSLVVAQMTFTVNYIYNITSTTSNIKPGIFSLFNVPLMKYILIVQGWQLLVSLGMLIFYDHRKRLLSLFYKILRRFYFITIKESPFYIDVLNLNVKARKNIFKRKTIIPSFTLKMNKNEVHSIIGNNGSGKTVLMNALSNKKPKLNENVYLNEMSRYDANLNKMIIHVKQSLNMNEDLTLTEFLIESCMALGYKLEISALDQFRNYENVLLSNVPKTIKIQSIFFLISLMKPDICLFDEITNDIANGFLEIIYKYIKSLKKKGITSILVTH
ncbi:MAG: hypothetical protein MHPSP_001861, partial [Paramarteilia canceri]